MGFGSSKSNSNQSSNSVQSSSSSNQAFPALSTALTPQIAQGGTANNAILNLLGVNGAPAQDTGFNNFKNSSGYNFIQNEGVRGIDSSNSAKGLLGSGSALKAITGYGSNLASTFLNNYLQSLTGVVNSGNSAANTLAGAGQQSQSSGTSTSTGQSTGNSTNLSFK